MPKWISFSFLIDTGKTKIWEVMNKDSKVILGSIKWYSPWRQYSFFPQPNTVFEKTCLKDIALFCDEKTREHRDALKQKRWEHAEERINGKH